MPGFELEYFNPLNLRNKGLLYPVIHPSSAIPTAFTAVGGQMYYHSELGEEGFWGYYGGAINEWRRFVTYNELTAVTLNFAGDSGTGSIDLDSQTLNIIGTEDEIETRADDQTLQIGLPNSIKVVNDIIGEEAGAHNLWSNTGANNITIGEALSTVVILGNLTVWGTQTIIDTETLSIEDSLIHLARNNSVSDLLDIGIYGTYYDGVGQVISTSGLFRNASSIKGEWVLYKKGNVIDNVVYYSEFDNLHLHGIILGDIESEQSELGLLTFYDGETDYGVSFHSSVATTESQDYSWPTAYPEVDYGVLISSASGTLSWFEVDLSGVISGSGEADQVAYFVDTNVLGGNNAFIYNSGVLHIGVGEGTHGFLALYSTTSSVTFAVADEDPGGNSSYTWPSLYEENKFLRVNAGGVLSWETIIQEDNYWTRTIPEEGPAFLYPTNLGDWVGIGIDTPSEQLEITQNFKMPVASNQSSVLGVFYKGINTFLHDFDLSGNASNIFVGKSAGNLTLTGSTGIQGTSLVGVGQFALNSNTTGRFNTAVGALASKNLTEAQGVTAVGFEAFGLLTTGSSGVAIGYQALKSTLSGSYNVGVGSAAGNLNETGSYNTYIGGLTGFNTLGSYNVFLGYSAGYNETGSNKLYIENSQSATPLIYGEFDNDLVRIYGNLQLSASGASVGLIETTLSDYNTRIPTSSAVKTYVDEAISQYIYLATGSVITKGTQTSGTYLTTNVHDNVAWTIREVTGVPGFDVELIFSGIVHSPTRLWLRCYYTGNHDVKVQMWDYGDSIWEDYITLLQSQANYEWIEISIPDPSEHTSGGEAKIRFYHAATGNTNHYLYVDYCALVKAGFGSTGDHSQLTGLEHDDHLQYVLLGGRAGGQIIKGGTLTTESLNLYGNSVDTTGAINLYSKPYFHTLKAASQTQVLYYDSSTKEVTYSDLPADLWSLIGSSIYRNSNVGIGNHIIEPTSLLHLIDNSKYFKFSHTGTQAIINAETKLDIQLSKTSLITVESSLVTVRQDLKIPIDKKFYIGNEDTNGSWRLYDDGFGHLIIEQRVSGSWNFAGKFTAV